MKGILSMENCLLAPMSIFHVQLVMLSYYIGLFKNRKVEKCKRTRTKRNNDLFWK